MRQTYLLLGERMEPPRFLKLWRIMMPLLVSLAKMAMLGLVVRRCSLALVVVSGSDHVVK